MPAPYKRIHVIINPASGKNQPILNVINDVCQQYDVAWDATVTHKYGDATAQARAAIAAGVDLIAGYGGDGTQHEVANAILSSPRQIPLAILPGGTGNGFCRENGVPDVLEAAVELMCTSDKRRQDLAERNSFSRSVQSSGSSNRSANCCTQNLTRAVSRRS